MTLDYFGKETRAVKVLKKQSYYNVIIEYIKYCKPEQLCLNKSMTWQKTVTLNDLKLT